VALSASLSRSFNLFDYHLGDPTELGVHFRQGGANARRIGRGYEFRQITVGEFSFTLSIAFKKNIFRFKAS